MGNNNRLLSLDVMRGITIAGMILVNNPGDWAHVYAPLAHAHWNGFTPTDMVFPFFMFMMGVSAYFSLRKYDFTWNKACVWKIVKRTVVIFFIGLALNGLSLAMFGGLEWERWRILGVLQRLALAYGVASFIAISISHKYLLHTAITLLILHSALLLGTHSLELTPDSLVAVIDRAVLGESHLYRDVMADGTRIAFDPEGLLGVVSSVAHVLIGMWAGKMIISQRENPGKIVINLFVYGCILLFCGLLLSYAVPINKKIWSSTFVLVTCGFGSLLLALLMYGIDIRKRTGWTRFFETFGVNPLYLYVQAELLARLVAYFGWGDAVMREVLTPLLGDYPASLAWALLFVLANWVPGHFLYKRHIYIKI